MRTSEELGDVKAFKSAISEREPSISLVSVSLEKQQDGDLDVYLVVESSTISSSKKKWGLTAVLGESFPGITDVFPLGGE
jgi:hypothetical protein